MQSVIPKRAIKLAGSLVALVLLTITMPVVANDDIVIACPVDQLREMIRRMRKIGVHLDQQVVFSLETPPESRQVGSAEPISRGIDFPLKYVKRGGANLTLA